MRTSFSSAFKNNYLSILLVVIFIFSIIAPFINWSGKDYLAMIDKGEQKEQRITVSTDDDLIAYFNKAYPQSKNAMTISFMSGPTASEEAAQIMKDCGINTAFTWDYSSLWDSYCNIYGIKYMPFLYGSIPSDCNVNLSPANISNAVSGFNYGDEPIYNQIANMEPLAENHAKYYGNKFFYWNLLGKFPDGDTQYMNGHTYEQYVQQYCDVVFKYVTKNRYISTDVYPLEYFENGDKVNYTVKDSWLATYELFAAKARDYEATFNFYVANTKHYNFRQLDLESLRWLVNVGLSYGGRSLSYFEYSKDPSVEVDGWSGGLVGKDGTTIYPEYYMAQTVNRELLNWDHVFLNFDYQDTKLLTGTLNPSVNGNFGSCIYNVDKLPGVEKTVADRDTILSHFKGKNGEDGYMITNFEDTVYDIDPSNIRVVFEDKNITKAIVYKNGEQSLVDVVNGEYNVTLDNGEMVFVVPYNLEKINGVDEEVEPIGDPEEEAKGIFTIKFETYCDDTIEPIKVQKGESIGSIKEISKIGYDFKGWYLDFDLYDLNTPVEKSMILDARFVPRKDISYSVKIYVEEQDGVWTDRTKLYKGMLGELKGTTDTEYDISDKARSILNELGSKYCFDQRVKGSVSKAVIKGDGSTEFVLYYPKLKVTSYCPYELSLHDGNLFDDFVYDNTIAYGNEAFSYKFTSTGADPRIYLNKDILDMLPDYAIAVSFYLYHEIPEYIQWRTCIPGAPHTMKGAVSAHKWNKITLTVDELHTLLDGENRGWVSIVRWNAFDMYYISGLYIEPSLERNVEEGYATVKFDTDGGNTIEDQKVLVGEQITKPADPKKPGYKFVGWYNGYTLFNFDQVVTYDVTLRAIWEEFVIEQNNFQIESVNGETVVKTNEVVYGNEEYSNKIVSSNWDAKFRFTDLVGITDESVSFYIYSTYGGQDYQNLHLFTGANGSPADTGISLVKDEWTKVTLTKAQFNNIINLGYVMQLRTNNGSIANADFYVSIIPETSSDEYVMSNGNSEIATDKFYGDEEYSIKVNSGDSTSDCKFFFNESILTSIPSDATTVKFYIYHEHGSEIPFHYIINQPFASTVVAMLKLGEWTEVSLTVEQFVNAVQNTSGYQLRAALWETCDYYVSYPQFSKEEKEKLQVELVSAGLVEKDTTFKHGTDEYSYKITPGAWDIKFTFSDLVNTTDSDVTIYIYSNFDKPDYQDLRLFYGSASAPIDVNIHLEKDAWTAVTINKTWFNNMVNLGYVLQIRTDLNHVTGYNYWISMIPKTSSNEYVMSNGNSEIVTDKVYGNEEFSIKVNSGSSTSDCKFIFDKSLLNDIPSGITNVKFYIYHEHGSDIPFHYIKNDTFTITVVSMLQSGKWTEINMPIEQFVNTVNDTVGYQFRAALWEACDYYVSKPIFTNEVPEKLKIELTSNGFVAKDYDFTYNSEEYSYKITPTAWDVKFKFNNVKLSDTDVTFYIYTNYDGPDYKNLRIFIGPSTSLRDQGIYLTLNSWTEFTLSKDTFNEIVSRDYIIQFRTDLGNTTGWYYWISMIPETNSDEWVTTNGTATKDTTVRYGEDTNSVKLNSGSAASDLKIRFNKVSQSYIPEGATSVKFYMYHEYGEDINLQLLNNDLETRTDIATLTSGKWTEIELTIDEFTLLCTYSTVYCLRAQLWDSCDYYISQLYFN